MTVTGEAMVAFAIDRQTCDGRIFPHPSNFRNQKFRRFTIMKRPPREGFSRSNDLTALVYLSAARIIPCARTATEFY